jgi:hypothetical protein
VVDAAFKLRARRPPNAEVPLKHVILLAKTSRNTTATSKLVKQRTASGVASYWSLGSIFISRKSCTRGERAL